MSKPNSPKITAIEMPSLVYCQFGSQLFIGNLTSCEKALQEKQKVFAESTSQKCLTFTKRY